MTSRRPVFLILTAMLVGCAPKATFDMAITNQTNRPVTVGVVKDGPPHEREWAGPEAWALESPLESLPPWGQVIPPGRTMDSPPITGTFPRGTTAHLRVYGGEHTNVELLTISSPSRDRAEVLLFPGHNEITVRTDDAGRLRADRAAPPRR
jgi:hypothetical protein